MGGPHPSVLANLSPAYGTDVRKNKQTYPIKERHKSSTSHLIWSNLCQTYRAPLAVPNPSRTSSARRWTAAVGTRPAPRSSSESPGASGSFGSVRICTFAEAIEERRGDTSMRAERRRAANGHTRMPRFGSGGELRKIAGRVPARRQKTRQDGDFARALSDRSIDRVSDRGRLEFEMSDDDFSAGQLRAQHLCQLGDDRARFGAPTPMVDQHDGVRAHQ